jgi:ornithine cyclodeaminase/alanine dehydrogenase-like protein (mu-crystallin family)
MQILSEAEVRRRLDPAALMAALELAFRERYSKVQIPARTHIAIEGGVLLTMPCYDPAAEVLGMKLVTVREGVQATYLLIDPANGRPRLTIEANWLTDLRTAVTSALATKFLARADAKTLGIFGTGRQARAHLAAMPLAGKFERVLICGRDEKKVRDFIAQFSPPLKVQAATAEQCAAEADVVCTCTTSGTPLFDGALLRSGTHLNLVGAFQPHTRELDLLAVKHRRMFVDTYDGVLAEAGEILIPMREGALKREDLAADLHELVALKRPGRVSEQDITLFKSVGCALEDLVAAELLLAS